MSVSCFVLTSFEVSLIFLGNRSKSSMPAKKAPSASATSIKTQNSRALERKLWSTGKFASLLLESPLTAFAFHICHLCRECLDVLRLHKLLLLCREAWNLWTASVFQLVSALDSAENVESFPFTKRSGWETFPLNTGNMKIPSSHVWRGQRSWSQSQIGTQQVFRWSFGMIALLQDLGCWKGPAAFDLTVCTDLHNVRSSQAKDLSHKKKIPKCHKCQIGTCREDHRIRKIQVEAHECEAPQSSTVQPFI